ncbi:MAG: hypothetical protein DCF20_08660 [Pseudanabaena sp.]|nr:MAG: hypothetical protein DCF20_08660 [Pseudanabaena sp.]
MKNLWRFRLTTSTLTLSPNLLAKRENSLDLFEQIMNNLFLNCFPKICLIISRQNLEMTDIGSNYRSNEPQEFYKSVAKKNTFLKFLVWV